MRRQLMCGVSALALAISAAYGPAQAQGIPVIDNTAIAKHIEQIAYLTQQLSTLQQQYQQLQTLYQSVSRLTDIGQLSNILNDPNVRQFLPANFSQFEPLLRGDISGLTGPLVDMTRRYSQDNTVFRSPADEFYARELARTGQQIDGRMAVGEQIMRTAQQRQQGLQDLLARITGTRDAAEKADLTNRLLGEIGLLNNDLMRVQGLVMLQTAQGRLTEQREQEASRRVWSQFRDAVGSSLPTQPPSFPQSLLPTSSPTN